MKQIKATRTDRCHDCGERISFGEMFWWAPNEAYCTECGPPAAGQPAGGTTTDEDVPGYVLQLRKKIDNLQAQVDQLGEVAKTMHNSLTVINAALIGIGEWAETLAKELGIDPPEVSDE